MSWCHCSTDSGHITSILLIIATLYLQIADIKMATASGESVERANTKSPDRDSAVDAEELIDDATAHLEKIADYKTYCKVRHLTFTSSHFPTHRCIFVLIHGE